jgi:hypothetical protein
MPIHPHPDSVQALLSQKVGFWPDRYRTYYVQKPSSKAGNQIYLLILANFLAPGSGSVIRIWTRKSVQFRSNPTRLLKKFLCRKENWEKTGKDLNHLTRRSVIIPDARYHFLVHNSRKPQTDNVGTVPRSVTDPGCLSRIWIFSISDPGSRVEIFPGSASASKNLSILTQKGISKL